MFVDPSSGTSLTIYDLQVQIDAKKEKFEDANGCVPFTVRENKFLNIAQIKQNRPN